MKMIVQNWRKFNKQINELGPAGTEDVLNNPIIQKAMNPDWFEEEEDFKELPKAIQRNSYLVFQGDRLKWMANGEVVKSWRATSGQLDLLPGVDYIQALKRLVQGKSNFGPTPEGIYRIPNAWQTGIKKTDPGLIDKVKYIYLSIKKMLGSEKAKIQLKNTTKFKDKDSVMADIAWGDYRVHIMKTKNSILANKYKRRGFFLHGGGLEGSSGCIDLGDNLKNFVMFWAVQSYATRRGMNLLVDYDDNILDKIGKKNPGLKRKRWFQDMVKYGRKGVK